MDVLMMERRSMNINKMINTSNLDSRDKRLYKKESKNTPPRFRETSTEIKKANIPLH